MILCIKKLELQSTLTTEYTYKIMDEIEHGKECVLVADRELKQIERQLILYDIFQQNEEDTRLSTIMFHLPGMNMRTLQRDIRDLTDAGVLQVYFSRDKNAYINYHEYRDISYYSEGIQKRIAKKRKLAKENKDVSPRKQEHLERLKRLTELMGYEVYEKAVELYFNLFPGATERMRKRDFEILRHVGFYAGFDKEEKDYVIYRKEGYGIYDDYGVYVKDGKMMYWVEER